MGQTPGREHVDPMHQAYVASLTHSLTHPLTHTPHPPTWQPLTRSAGLLVAAVPPCMWQGQGSAVQVTAGSLTLKNGPGTRPALRAGCTDHAGKCIQEFLCRDLCHTVTPALGLTCLEASMKKHSQGKPLLTGLTAFGDTE